MEWYRIPEITLKDYIKCLDQLYKVLENKNISKTDIDPFMQGMLMGVDSITPARWDEIEKVRLKTKNLEMKMGDFHEELMGKFPGWKTLPLGHVTECDVMKDDGTAVLEVKNKANTCNSGGAKDVIRKLTKQLENGVETVVFVQVNCPGGKVNRFNADPRIKVWNGKDTYKFLSGRDTFFEDLLKTTNYTFQKFKTYDELKAFTVANTAAGGTRSRRKSLTS